jgi:hypothetical protein
MSTSLTDANLIAFTSQSKFKSKFKFSAKSSHNLTVRGNISTYVLGTFLMVGCLMKIMHTTELPTIPLKKIIENRIGTKYVSIRAEYGTKSSNSVMLVLVTLSNRLDSMVDLMGITLGSLEFTEISLEITVFSKEFTEVSLEFSFYFQRTLLLFPFLHQFWILHFTLCNPSSNSYPLLPRDPHNTKSSDRLKAHQRLAVDYV